MQFKHVIAWLIPYREIWVESLSQAIRTCTEDNANSILPVGKPCKYALLDSPLLLWWQVPLQYLYGFLVFAATSNQHSGQPYTTLTLTVLQANNLALSSSNCKTRNHYCGVHLGSQKCRTPSVKAKCWPSWNYQVLNLWHLLTRDIIRLAAYRLMFSF